MLGDLFDPDAEVLIREGILPHWSQNGVLTFITAHDSIPKEVLERWGREKQEWVAQRGHQGRWSEILPSLDQTAQNAFHREFNRHREDCLDDNLGSCLLRDPANANIVADALLHFDGERYEMGDFVIMPNHIHLLVALPEAAVLSDLCDSWLHYTATQINRRMNRRGNLWQQEPFDHLVCSAEQFEYLRTYLAENPRKAGLAKNEYLYREHVPNHQE